MSRSIPILAAFLACVGSTATHAFAQADHWSIRASGHPGTPRSTISDSDVNNGRPQAKFQLQAQAFAQRRQAGAEVRVFADAASLAALRAPEVDASIEMDRALDWLRRLAGNTPARIELIGR